MKSFGVFSDMIWVVFHSVIIFPLKLLFCIGHSSVTYYKQPEQDNLFFCFLKIKILLWITQPYLTGASFSHSPLYTDSLLEISQPEL